MGPSAPGEPFSPGGPGGPAGPGSPGRPAGPVSPRGPLPPSLPLGPGGPGRPMLPWVRGGGDAVRPPRRWARGRPVPNGPRRPRGALPGIHTAARSRQPPHPPRPIAIGGGDSTHGGAGGTDSSSSTRETSSTLRGTNAAVRGGCDPQGGTSCCPLRQRPPQTQSSPHGGGYSFEFGGEKEKRAAFTHPPTGPTPLPTCDVTHPNSFGVRTHGLGSGRRGG